MITMNFYYLFLFLLICGSRDKDTEIKKVKGAERALMICKIVSGSPVLVSIIIFLSQMQFVTFIFCLGLYTHNL